ncbi:Putative MFS-type transporter C09D4.1 [Gryllus bimaculatus]|nr:Putative MFS-type transporter C09D4.1 [Gryllus bimaculatus]
MLLLFTLTSASNAVQWIQFAIITEPVMRFYGVSADDVNWTSMIYMVTYVPLVFPAAWLLDRMGLRVCVTLGAMGTCAGASLKAFAAEPWLWSLAFAGQAITAMSQTCLLGVPARLAAVWFPSTELASATAVGVFGNQLGIAVGFLVPPFLVHNETNVDDMRPQLHLLFASTAAVTATLLLLVILLFRAAPDGSPPPPEEPVSLGEFASGVRRLMTHRNFLLLLVAYALNVGSFYAVSTLLGQAVAARVNDSAEHAGVLGLVMVVAGMLGSVICGVILDRTRRYKEVTLAVYVMSLVGLILYAGALASRSLGYLYFASISLGFFMTGYLPLGFELAAELTYPEPEGTSSGLLNAGAQLGGLASTPAYAAPAGQRAATFVAPTPAVAAALRAGMGRVPCRPVHLPNTCFHSRARVRATPRLLDALDVAHVDD